MDNLYESQMEEVVKLVAIRSSTLFDFGGEAIAVPLKLIKDADVDRSIIPIVKELQQSIYNNCYARRSAFMPDEVVSPASALTTTDAASDQEINEELSRANCSQNYQETGWRIVEVLAGGKIVAQKRKVERCFWPGEYITESGPGTPPFVGSSISVYFQKESREVQPGFYYAYGESVCDAPSAYEIVRYYFNVSCQGAPILIKHLTGRFNNFFVPFRLKCSNHIAGYARIDTAVLYVQAKHYRIVAEILLDLAPTLESILREDTPILTKRLTWGIAFAEEPATGESFGMNRSRLIAEALWSAFSDGKHSPAEKLAAVKGRFEEHGLRYELPYLREGSTGYYEFPTFG